MTLDYNFLFEDGQEIKINIDPDFFSNGAGKAFWAKLDFHKCDICPLGNEANEYCPAATGLHNAARHFGNRYSFDQVLVTVVTPERSYTKECDLQTALNSLFGLIMPISGCPVLAAFRPMAMFHLPFSSFEDSLVRTVSFYLLKQYFVASDSQEPDFILAKLEAFYKDLGTVNRNIKERISHAGEKDANVNAINAFFSLSTLINFSLKDKLEEVRNIFE